MRFYGNEDENDDNDLIPPRPSEVKEKPYIRYPHKIREINSILNNGTFGYERIEIRPEEFEYISEYYANYEWRFEHEYDSMYSIHRLY